jgi:hypothetical protein
VDLTTDGVDQDRASTTHIIVNIRNERRQEEARPGQAGAHHGHLAVGGVDDAHHPDEGGETHREHRVHAAQRAL